LTVKRNQQHSQISIIIPTYNESQNIVGVLKLIKENLPRNTSAQAIVVDDNSPDGTGKIVDDYLGSIKNIANYTVDIIHRKTKKGLSSAILSGLQYAKGETIVIMDSDFSHPPYIIPKLIDTLKKYQCDIVVASRYLRGGKITGWSLKRRIISKCGTMIAKKGLGIKSSDPMSGFFAFKRNLLEGISFDAIGYKLLLEILVKRKNAKVKEVPYIFPDRKFGSSKLDIRTIVDFIKSVWRLYRYGKKIEQKEYRDSVKFLSKAARFYTVGASGFFVNYLMSLLFADSTTGFWYLHANIIGILASMTSNFVLNKAWTFGDRDFSPSKTLVQYGKFVGFSSFGALIQLGMVFSFVESGWSYPIALGIGVLTGAFSNYILNKKWTFKEKLWS